jgi:hypothetical protein
MDRYNIALHKKFPSSGGLLAALKESGPNILTKEDYQKAEKDINEHMERFEIEYRAYMAYSREAARKAYMTF